MSFAKSYYFYRQILSETELLGVHSEGIFLGSGGKIDLAVIHENIILFTTRIGHASYLQILELKSTDAIYSDTSVLAGIEGVRNLGRCSPEATCLDVCLIAQNLCAVIAEYCGDSVRLIFQPLNGTDSHILDVPTTCGGNYLRLEAFVSVTVVSDSPGHLVLVCGTRNGILVTLEIDENSIQIVQSYYDRIGATPAIVKRDEYSGPRDIVFVNCDSKIYALIMPLATDRPSPRIPRTRKIFQIFLTDALNPALRQPAINSISRLRSNLSGGTDGGLLLVSGSQILLAGLSTQPKAVPQYIPIRGTPSRLLYSHHLGCLIVAASVNGRSTLLFIDPDTGENISSPLDKKNGNSVDFVSGLGNFNERVFRLLEWSYVKGGKEWRFIIVCTSTGRLLIISTQNGDMTPGRAHISEQQSGNRIRYWTLHRFKCGKPVFSVTGSDEGLFDCSGNMLYCETLDIAEKRFKRVAEYTLPSPALNLVCRDRRIYALTSTHSLEILKIEIPDTGMDEALSNVPGVKIIRTHGDEISRNCLHHRIISQSSESPIDLVSDKSCSVVGLWGDSKHQS